MSTHSSVLTYLLVAEVRRRLFEESYPRIEKCLSLLSEEEIWHRPNEHLVSVGNLVLHLCGNVRQWIVSGLGEVPDDRNRNAEFGTKGPLSSEELLDRLDKLQVDVEQVLDNLTPGKLAGPVNVQGFEETGISVLVHVIEHFSYHVGQITWYTKLIKNQDLGYYSGLDLNITG